MTEEEFLKLEKMDAPPRNAEFVKSSTVGYDEPCFGYVCAENGMALTVFRTEGGGTAHNRGCIRSEHNHYSRQLETVQ